MRSLYTQVILATAALSVCGAPPARAQSPGPPRLCQSAHPAPISEDSIGPLNLERPLGDLKRACASSYDTTAALSPDRPKFPGVAFPFKDLSVVALQYSGANLDTSRAADGWVVAGGGGVLPNGVPTTATWSQLYHRYGRAQANMRGVLLIRFCALPRILFTMNVVGGSPKGGVVPRAEESDSTDVVDLTKIPAESTIHHLFILSKRLAASLLPCK